ncbi:hypothetical protein TRAPUB_2733 [Trametes pubescens]|uniref:Uncharacterized protein n=1 Tax=Trametes pubescens TaxID=154538 RepID=A0A1M2VFX6_TRAPU|nr:hypothetical protein TRAPUB_2733 [Trametes pubescens]
MAPSYDDDELSILTRLQGQDVASDDRDTAFEPVEHSQVAAPAPRPPAPVAQAHARLRNVQCEWGRCDKVLWRLMWQAHMDEEHKLRHQGYKTASWHCQWRRCKHVERTHELMETNLRERHFVRDIPFCGMCSKLFVTLDYFVCVSVGNARCLNNDSVPALYALELQSHHAEDCWGKVKCQ